jgi:hypothetical protein
VAVVSSVTSGREGRERGGAGSDEERGMGSGAPTMVNSRSAAERGSMGKMKLTVWIRVARRGGREETRIVCRCLEVTGQTMNALS